MSEQHTQGPWTCQRGKHGTQWQVMAEGPRWPTIIGEVYAGSGQPVEANARLIASSPLGHEIIQALADWFVSGHSPQPSSMFDGERTWRQAVQEYLAKVEVK